MKTKVAVLGGGMGALSAAWALAKTGNYDITVYQRGWRLGGKGASGRNLAAYGSIEEHGLHVLMGFYDQAFNVMKECYAAAPQSAHGPLLPFGAGAGATFTAADSATFSQEWKGEWSFYQVNFPTAPGLPWDPPPTIDFEDLFTSALNLFLEELVPAVGDVLGLIAAALAEIEALVQAAIGGVTPEMIEAILSTAWTFAQPNLNVANKRWAWMGLCFAGANLIGMLRAGLNVSNPNFDALNGTDYRQWLANQLTNVKDFFGNGPPPEVSWNSPFVVGLYDLAFSADTTLAAGVTLKVCLLFAVGYRGHIAFKMNSGMGDIVFAPLYLALQSRGVKFRFFHRVQSVQTDGTSVTAIALEPQVGIPGGTYDPLVTVKGHPCWPNQPDASQLSIAYQLAVQTSGGAMPFNFEVDGPASPFAGPTITLTQAGGDFDIVVLGISVGALSKICAPLCAAQPPFQAMCENLNTMPTQAVQVWMTSPAASFGGPVLDGYAISYVRPFNSWADMSQLIPNEAWPAGTVQSISYFCDAYDGPRGSTAGATVGYNAVAFLNGGVQQGLWPGFAYGTPPVQRRYTRVNVDASDGYVLTEAGATPYRLAPGDSGFRNLALAGDWVQTSLNAGCLEGATRGGRQRRPPSSRESSNHESSCIRRA